MSDQTDEIGFAAQNMPLPSAAVIVTLGNSFQTCSIAELFIRAFKGNCDERELTADERNFINRDLRAFQERRAIPPYVVNAFCKLT